MSVRSQRMKSGRCLAAASRSTSALRRLGVDVDEGDPGVLTGKGLDHGGADAGAAAGDEDDAVGETGIAGEDQRSLL